MARNLKYVGDAIAHLKTGETYRISELAKLTNNTYRCLRQRLKGKDEVTDWDLRARAIKNIPKSWANQANKPIVLQCETKSEILMQKWLRKAI